MSTGWVVFLVIMGIGLLWALIEGTKFGKWLKNTIAWVETETLPKQQRNLPPWYRNTGLLMSVAIVEF